MIKTGVADTYRNEQYISKNDKLYELEMLLHSCNMNSLDKNKVRENLNILLNYYIKK